MTEYILHADDFGISDSVNVCVDACFMKGKLSETSLMVNMPMSDSAVALAMRNGYERVVGLHLNMSEGYPLTESIRKCPRFCNSDGAFNKLFHLSMRSRFFLSLQEADAVRLEIEAQIRRFCSFGGLMKRIDSHHHVHTDWSIYRILKPLAIRYGFTSMRISADLHMVRFHKEIYKRIINCDIRRNFATTTHFDAVCKELLVPLSGSVEVMVHPLMHDGILSDTDVPYEEQMALLGSVPDSIIRTL